MKKLTKVMAVAVMTLSMSTNVFAADAGYVAELKSRISHLEQVEKQLTAAAEKDPQQNSALAALKGQLLVYKQDLAKQDPAAAAQIEASAAQLAAGAAQVASGAVNAVAAQTGMTPEQLLQTQQAAVAAMIQAQQQKAAAAQPAAQQKAADEAAKALQNAAAAAAAAAQQVAPAVAAAAQQAAPAVAAAAQQAAPAVAAAAQQAAPAVAAAVPAVAAASGHKYTDSAGNSHTFTAEEWKYLLSKWEYTGQAEELITHHPVGDLLAILAAR